MVLATVRPAPWQRPVARPTAGPAFQRPWRTPRPPRARHLHRSPIVLESVGDYLAGQRYDIGLIHADASIYKVPQLTRPVPEEAGATLDDVLVQIH